MRRCVILLLFLVTVFTAWNHHALAQYNSSNYRVYEYNFGSGGGNTSSANYQAQQSVGPLGVGQYTSANYRSYPGPVTPQVPYLSFLVNSANTNLGVLSSSSTATTTGAFSVRTYLASGYVVTTVSSPPTNSSFTMNNISSAATSAIGTEQFGMNLVKNTSCTGLPNPLGADAAQIPDTSFSFGTAASGYNTNCKFQYNANDVIAQSSSSSGETDFTISFIFNISSTTPGGTYVFNDVLVATSTF